MSQAAGSGGQPPAMGGQMFMILIFMLMMTVLMMNPNFRTTLSVYADPVLSPWLPEESYFTVTVLIIGSCSMLINTVLRNFFIDPVEQAHIGHRMGQVRKMQNEARMARDNARMEKAQTLQMSMMPEQMKVQMGGMKPMMFTFIFIVAIFSWIALAVENFRVGYVSLPWLPKWDMMHDKFLFFPAWVATYICLSAPMGRAVDRHIKLWRYKSNPIVVAGEKIKEPLIHLIKSDDDDAVGRRRRSKNGPRKRNNQGNRNSNSDNTSSKAKALDNSKDNTGGFGAFGNSDSSDSTAGTVEGKVCPECDCEEVQRLGNSKLRCRVCRHSWR
jgi:uncharacterized membrane protein (DUF106 family)